ncbi:MAG TPA: hypothetical protein VFY84_18680 [Jiangellales bacterium]|nr:hypothetical protein [Jiangellales bacterium]
MDDFEAFVRQRSAALARTAYLLTSDRHLAEDLLQDTLARAAERWRVAARNGGRARACRSRRVRPLAVASQPPA